MADDPWAAFTAGPAAPPPAVVAQPTALAQPAAPAVPVASAAPDPWAAFTASPSDPGTVAPPAAADPSQDGWDTQWGAAAAPKKSGYAANVAAGVIEGGAGVLNVLSDPVGNLVGKPLAIIGGTAYDAIAPHVGLPRMTDAQRADLYGEEPTQPGTRLVNALDAANVATGAPTSVHDVVPATTGQSIVRSVVPAAVGMAALGGGDGVMRNAVVNPLLGVSGDLTGKAAAAFVPDWLKPAAELGGNVVGTAVPNSLLHYAGSPGAKQNPLMDDAGEPIVSKATGQALTATDAEAAAAGKQNRQAATDPDAVRAKLDNPPPPVMPGDQPTTAKLTGDPGLNTAEFTASRTGTDQQKAAYIAQANAQNDARVRLIQGQAPEGVPAVAEAALKDHAAAAETASAADVAQSQRDAAAGVAATDAAGQARVAGLTQNANATLTAVGGDRPSGSEADVGAALRAPVADAAAEAGMARGALYDAVDPGNKLALDMSPVREGGNAIVGDMSANDAGMGPKEAAIFNKVAALPDVQKFADLRALRTSITDQIRTDRGPSGDPQAVRRLSMLLGHVEGVMNDAVGDAEIAPPGVPPAITDPGSAPGSAPDDLTARGIPPTGTTAYTPSGTPVDVRYRVRESSDLIPSQLPDGRPHPEYPQELQPRDRTRAASQLQVNSMANNLTPERLGASASTAEGAPIVGPDGIVESGNGRTMAIQKAYAEGSPKAGAYRQWIASQGFDVSGMKQPIMVRERTTPMDMTKRGNFAREAGASPVLAMSASERAASDAKALPNDALSLWRGGDVADARNAEFARAFALHALPEGERAGFMTADGGISQEGSARMRNALTQRAYGSNSLVSALAEDGDPNIKAFGGALMDAAGDMAKLRGAMDSGTVSKANDIGPALIEAANLIQTAKRQRISLADAVAQRDAFSQPSVAAETILRLAFGDNLAGRMSRAKFANLVSDYSEKAQVQSGLFGANETSGEMLADAGRRYGYGTTSATKNESAGSVIARSGGGIDRDQVRGPRHAPAGQEDAGSATAGNPGGAAPATDAAVPAAESGLTPNLDADAVARLRAANAQNVADKQRFNNAPGVGEMLRGGPAKGTFATPASAVPNLIVRVGPAGADVAKAYLKAGGDPAALSDAAAYSLRQAAMRPDGTLDPAKVGVWAKARSSFLSQIPADADRFSAAADAQRAVEVGAKDAALSLKEATASAQKAVDDAMAKRAAGIKEMQRSAIGKFLGDADPVATVWSILNDKKNGAAQAGELMAAIAHDPDAVLGLQRSVAAAIEREVVGNSRGATSEEGGIRAEKFQNLIKNAGPALAEIMNPEQMRAIQAAHETLQRDYTSGQVGAGSATGQIQSGNQRGVVRAVASNIKGMVKGGGLGALIGGYLAGGPGAYAGMALGSAIAAAVKSAREAGIQNIQDLRTESLLNPTLYRLLDTRVTDANRSGLLGAVANTLRRGALIGAVQGQPDDQRPPRNALAR